VVTAPDSGPAARWFDGVGDGEGRGGDGDGVGDRDKDVDGESRTRRFRGMIACIGIRQDGCDA
jgi:hypothetical protein